jgi:hypothetical protein
VIEHVFAVYCKFCYCNEIPFSTCVLKTVKMICNSIVYLINKYNFDGKHLF